MATRAVGVRVVAVLLAWQALASAWSVAWLLRELAGAGPVRLVPALQTVAGAAAAVAAYALWRRRRWALRAYAAWACLTLAAHAPLALWLGLAAAEPGGRLRSWWWVPPAAALLVAAALLTLLGRYLRRRLEPAGTAGARVAPRE